MKHAVKPEIAADGHSPGSVQLFNSDKLCSGLQVHVKHSALMEAKRQLEASQGDVTKLEADAKVDHTHDVQ